MTARDDDVVRLTAKGARLLEGRAGEFAPWYIEGCRCQRCCMVRAHELAKLGARAYEYHAETGQFLGYPSPASKKS